MKCIFYDIVSFCFEALLVTGEGFAFLAFAAKFPYVLFNMFSFSILSAIGQVSIISSNS